MNDLSNTIAHILEHERHLAEANEPTTQQYVILPILRALGWDDANLALMEVLPEYRLRVEEPIMLYTSNAVRVLWCSLNVSDGDNQSGKMRSKSVFTPTVEISHLR